MTAEYAHFSSVTSHDETSLLLQTADDELYDSHLPVLCAIPHFLYITGAFDRGAI